MSRVGSQQPACVGLGHAAKNLISMDLDTTVSLLQDATAEVRKMIVNLKSNERLESDHEPPSKKRKIEKEKSPVGVREQVEKAINEVALTEDWSGKCAIQGLIRGHATEWTRKWGLPYGVYHDLLRVYPECGFEINRDRNNHDTIFRLVDNFRSACDSLRREGTSVAKREASRVASKKEAALKAAKRGKESDGLVVGRRREY